MENKTLIVASGNKGKLKEIKAMLPEYNVIDYKSMGVDIEIEETGSTFYENALIKAKTVAEILNLPTLADDSGICVDALNDEPGIYSARYSGDGVDEHNNDLLLKNLENNENRKARFVCCMVLFFPNGKILTATGETHGTILYERQGNHGFGYDPIFFSNDLKKCFGIASEEEKNSVSHRFRALQKLKEQL